jgi:PAS domain S-box-containing protein
MAVLEGLDTVGVGAFWIDLFPVVRSALHAGDVAVGDDGELQSDPALHAHDVSILHANRAALSFFGLAPAERCPSTVGELLLRTAPTRIPWARAMVERMVLAVIGKAATFREEIVVGALGGELRRAMLTIQVPQSEAAARCCLAVVMPLHHDRSELAQMRADSLWLAALRDGAEVAAWVVAPDGRLCFATQAARALLWSSIAERPFEWAHPLDVPALRSAHDRALGLGGPQIVVMQRGAAAEPANWITVRVARAGEATSAPLVVCTAVAQPAGAAAEQRRGPTEPALAVARERAELALQGTRHALWDWTLATGEVYYSAGFFEMLGYAVGELPYTDASWRTSVHPEDLPAAYQAMEAHLSGRAESYTARWRMQKRDGSYLWVEARGRAQRDASGQPLRVVGFILDVHAQVQAEETLRRALLQAEAANGSKSQFLAAMSHEVRTPLAGVVGLVDLLRTEPLSASAQQTVDLLSRSVDSLRTVVSNVLDWTRIDAGKLEPESVVFDPRQWAQDVVGLFSELAARSGLTLGLHVEPTVPRALRSDPVRLRQVLSNLVGNAIKFTERGDVTVSVSLRTTEGAAPKLHVEVLDTGTGITREQQLRIFSAYEQGQSAASREGHSARPTSDGSGLGLAICRSIMDALGGAIGVESRPLEGSRFWFEVAVVSAHEGELARPTPLVLPKATRPLCLLVVEDNDIVRHLLEKMLTAMGHVVCAASGVTEARGVLEHHMVDAALIDFHLRDGDGADFARGLRAEGRAPLALIGITALDEEELASGTARQAFDATLTKPIDWSLLHQLLETRAEAHGRAAVAVFSPALDLGHFRSLESALGTEAAADLMAAMLVSARHELELLEEAVARHDESTVRRRLHTLKGLARNFGAAELAAAADAGRARGGSWPQNASQELVPRLRGAFERLDAEWQQGRWR